MAERRKMTEEELLAHLRQALETAAYERDDTVRDNVKALEYIDGKVSDVPAERGKSQAVSMDVADTIGWLMPQVMRTFTSSDRIWEFEPRTPQDVESARQATEYNNYVFMEECNGYRVLHDGISDGFAVRNGIWKVWWDDTAEFDVSEYHGISEAHVQALVSSDDAEVIAFSDAEPEVVEDVDPETGAPMQREERRFDIKVKTKLRDGRPMVKAIPPERFFVEPGVTCIEEARFVGDWDRRTRSDLVEAGYDRDKVDEIPADHSLIDGEVRHARWGDLRSDIADGEPLDRASEYVEVYETFIKLDFDGDGVSEWRRCVVAGRAGQSVLLEQSEWDDDVPYTPVIPDPVAHRFWGRSIYDRIADIQRQKTVVRRQILDNIYQHNNPTPVINGTIVRDDSAIEAMMTLDGSAAVVEGEPASAVYYHQTPFIGDKALMVMEELDQVREMRTGMSRVSQGLNQDVLANQSATAVMEATSAAHSRLEMYARNIAEMSLKRLGKQLHRLIVQNQNRPRIIRLRGKFVEVDPRPWSADMDVSVNTGLGTGSRDRDAAALNELGMGGLNIIQNYGPDNPVFGLQQMREIMAKMAETRGLKNYEMIVGGGDGEIQQWQEQQAQQPDPAQAEAQAKAQAEMQKQQMQMQADQAKLQQEGQIKSAEMQQEGELKRQEMMSRQAIERERLAADMQMKREQMQQELALKRETTEAELALKREFAHLNASNQAAQIRIGGNPG